MKNERFYDALIACVGVVAGMLLGLRWVQPGKVVYFGDGYWFFHPLNFPFKHLFAWNTVGTIDGKFSSSLHVMWNELFLNAFVLFFGPSFGQMLAIGCLFGLGWAGLFLMLRTLSFGRLPAALAATGYALNPWMQIGFPGNFTIEWAYVLAPYCVALLITAARTPERRALCTAVLAGIAAIPASLAGTNLGVLLMFLLAIVYGIVMAYQQKPNPQFTRWLIRTMVLCSVCALWWLVPIIFEYLLSVPIGVTSAVDWSFVVRRASFANVLRLNPFWGWELAQYFPYAFAYDRNVLTYASGFLLFAFAMLALVFRYPERRRLVQFSFGAALVLLFLSKGLHEPLAWINAIVYKLPFSALWREPTTKFPIVALVVLAPCVASTFERAYMAIRSAGARIGAALAVGIAFAISCEAMLTGAVYSQQTLQLPSSYVSVPPYWFDFADALNARNTDGSVLVLPYDGFYQVDYGWGLHSVDILPVDLLNRQTIVIGNLTYTSSRLDVGVSHYVHRAFEKETPNLPPFLRLLGVRYVLFRGDMVRGNYIIPTLAQIRHELPGASVTKFGPLTLFDLGPPQPLVTLSSQWIEGNYAGRAPEELLALASVTENFPRIDIREFEKKPLPGTKPLAFENIPQKIDTRSPVHAILPLTTAIKSLPLARALPSVTGIDEDANGIMTINVANPTNDTLRTYLNIGVLPREDTRYVLTLDKATYTDTIAASDTEVYAVFHGVVLLPGLHDLTLTPYSAGGGRHARGSFGLRIGNASIRVRAEGSVVADAIRGDARYDNTNLLYLRQFGTLRVTVPLDNAPTVGVLSRPNVPATQLAAMVLFDWSNKKYGCYLPLSQNAEADVETAVVACFDTNGLPVTNDVVRHITVTGLDLYAVLRHDIQTPDPFAGTNALDVRWEHPFNDNPPLLPKLRVQALPNQTPVRTVFPNISITPASDAFIRYRQAYSRTWMALCFGACSLVLPHYHDTGGWNAWWVAGHGTVAIVNVLVIVQWLVSLASICALGLAMFGLRSRGEDIRHA